MATKAKAKIESRRKVEKTEWDKLPKREREKLEEDYIVFVLDGKHARAHALAKRIAKLKGIKLRGTTSRR